ncbi:hypothetical protein [Nocardia sp. NPDC051750]|uniref:hypothetical protein n=1 Tax=Nocardia sp. NPDC051750 TaxID=3364325 RepID=UPI0037B063CA
MNIIHPTAVDTFMIHNPHSPMTDGSDLQAFARVLPIDRLQPIDVSRAILKTGDRGRSHDAPRAVSAPSRGYDHEHENGRRDE